MKAQLTKLACRWRSRWRPRRANGYVTPDGGPKQFYIDLNQSNITNQVGFTKVFPYSLGGQYTGKAYCDTPIPRSPHFTSRIRRCPSDYGNGYLKLNDFLDLKAEVWIAGNKKAYVTVPFTTNPTSIPITAVRRPMCR